MPSIILLAGLLAVALYIVYGAFTYGHRRRDMPPGKSPVLSLHSIVDQLLRGPKTLPFIGNLHLLPKTYTHIQ